MSEDKLERGDAIVAPHTEEVVPLVGGFSYDGRHDRWTWAPEVYRIHGFEPHDVVPTTQLIRFHAHPEDREAVDTTLTAAMESPRRFYLTFRLVDAGGATRRVLLLGTGSQDDRGVHLRGELVDLTSLQDEILNEDLSPMVDDFREHRAIIEQAKGIVIQLFAVDADEAFERLRACSQAANVKVRDLAQYLVVAAAQDRTPGKVGNGLNLAEVVEVLAADAE
jgi:PAS domain-containing protein